MNIPSIVIGSPSLLLIKMAVRLVEKHSPFFFLQLDAEFLKNPNYWLVDLPVNEIGPQTRHLGLVVQCHHAGSSLLHSGHRPLITPHRQKIQEIKNGITNISSRCGTSRYKHIVKRKQKMAKQIGVPIQNLHLFLRNKFTLVVYSCESLVILWNLFIWWSNLKTKLIKICEASFNGLHHENQEKV